MKILLFIGLLSFAALAINALEEVNEPLFVTQKAPLVLCGCKPDTHVCDTDGKEWPSYCELTCANHPPVEYDPEGKCLQKSENENSASGNDFKSSLDVIKKYLYNIFNIKENNVQETQQGGAEAEATPEEAPLVLCGCPPEPEPVCDKEGGKWASLCALECKNHPPVEYDPEGKCLLEEPVNPAASNSIINAGRSAWSWVKDKFSNSQSGRNL